MSEQRFPLLLGPGGGGGLTIPWSVAEEAYIVYAKRYGTTQSLKGLPERGGFGVEELDNLRPGWRPVAQEIETLRTEVARLTAREKRLVEALKPFAVFHQRGWAGTVWEDRDSNVAVLIHDERHPTETAVRLGDFARAAMLLGPPAGRG